MTQLQIYVADDCWTCEESFKIAEAMRRAFPGIEVTTVDINRERRPSNVFAAPTYVLDGKVIFLGNPRRQELVEKLRGAQDVTYDVEQETGKRTA